MTLIALERTLKVSYKVLKTLRSGNSISAWFSSVGYIDNDGRDVFNVYKARNCLDKIAIDL